MAHINQGESHLVIEKVRDDEGRLVNNHTNNKPHPTLGLHLESAATHG